MPPSARRRSARVAQLLDATLNHRRIGVRYHSFSSNREKDYVLEPYRLVFAQGGLYLVAFVPEYKQLRTFAVERMLSLSMTEERFEPMELPDDAFAHSLGVNQGTPERDRDHVRATDRALREGTRVARLAADRGARRHADDDAERVQRLGAPQLDPRLRPARARRLAAGARDADPRRDRARAVRATCRGKRETCEHTCQPWHVRSSVSRFRSSRARADDLN